VLLRMRLLGMVTATVVVSFIGCNDQSPGADNNNTGECGNGLREGSEECDGEDLNDQTCEDLGLEGGTLTCTSLCTLDTDDCVTGPCPNGVVEPDEECDGEDLNGVTCADFGFVGGTLTCSGQCTLDTAGCNSCGNGVVEPPEVCDDGNDFLWDGCGDCEITEIQVSSDATGGNHPDVALAADGSFVVVWEASFLTQGIVVRRYASSGQPLGDELEISAGTSDGGRHVAAGMAADGRFVVTWEDHTGESGPWQWRTYARLFDVSGNPVDSAFEVNSAPNCEQGRPDVAMAADGRFVVVWQRECQPGSGDVNHNIYAQRFDSAGEPVGAELPVNTYTADIQRLSNVAVRADGSFVVVWQSHLQDGEEFGIYGQRFGAGGNPQGGELPVNSYTTSWQTDAKVAAAADGRFVVVWESKFQEGEEYGVFGQRFDAGGNPQGGEFQVNSYTDGGQQGPAVAMAPDGRFVVVWHSDDPLGGETVIFGQRFDASGTPQGGEFQINVRVDGGRGGPAVAMADDGSFVVVWWGWQGDGPWMESQVYVQRFDRSGNPLGLGP